MTMALKLDLDMVEMYLDTGKEIPSDSSSNVTPRTDRQTDPTEIITYPHSTWMVKNCKKKGCNVLLKNCKKIKMDKCPTNC